MNAAYTHRILATALTFAVVVGTAAAQTTRFDALANMPFAENRPTQETAQALRDELLFQRATQTYLWAMPLVSTLGMQVASEQQFGAGYPFGQKTHTASRSQACA